MRVEFWTPGGVGPPQQYDDVIADDPLLYPTPV